ncbi:MAG: hypothetical protein KA210_00090 [Bacteroidia bacterium]|nr:hypothetical protein [Bacteroidia bacterium]
MKRIYFILISLFLLNQAFCQKIAFQKIDCTLFDNGISTSDYNNYSYLNNSIAKNISDLEFNVVKICEDGLKNCYWYGVIRDGGKYSNIRNNDGVSKYLQKIKETSESIKKLGYTHLLFYVDIENKSDQHSIIDYISTGESLKKSNEIFVVRFIIRNLIDGTFKDVELTISTSGETDLSLESCSNVKQFASEIKDFVKGSNSNSTTNEEEFNNSIELPEVTKPEVNAKKKKSFSSSINSEGKFKLVRVKERNASTNSPILVDVYDKNQQLNVGDNIIITRTDEVNIPGERKTIKSETTIGKARITEAFNKPLFTAKLIGNAGSNMKNYKDGDENYNAIKGVENITNVATPKIMVIPKKIDASKFVNGEYQLAKSEKMLIAAFKNKFEDNKFTTFGFESAIKNIFEQRQFQDNTQEDIKSKILEAAGMDFYVEYENLDQSNNNCEKVFDFKIRNYSTGEDVASDLKSLNICGSPDDFKVFAGSILSSGAISKINKQFSSLVENGKKVSVVFTLANSSSASFDKEFNGVKLGVHIENCLQELALNGNLDIEGVVNLRMETTVNIPVIDENNGKSYTTYMFSENIIEYLKKNAGVTCKSSVSKQIVNIIIQ